MSDGEEKKIIKISTIIYSVIIIAIGWLVAVLILLYIFNSNNFVVRNTAQIVPIPAAFVGYGQFITYGELESQLASVRKFYENQDFEDMGMRVDFSTPDGQKRLEIKKKELLNKLIENKIIEAAAKERGIKLTDAMVSEEVDREINDFQRKDLLKEDLMKLYGWNITDFEKNIVKPDLYKQRLSEHLEKNDPGFIAAKDRITAAKNDLDGAMDFGEVVKKYSDGDSAGNGGELGWYRQDQMLPQIADKIPDMEINRPSEIIRSPLGYHIVIVLDEKKDGQHDSFRLKQIFVRGRTLADWLDEEQASLRIAIPLRNYYWDKETRSVQFQSKELKDFENRTVSDDGANQ